MILTSPVGQLDILATYCGLESLEFKRNIDDSIMAPTKPHSLEKRAAQMLTEYFKGEHRAPFNQELPLYLKGSAFQITVWNALLKIPYGERVSYNEFATSFGLGDAARAVSTAIEKNPLPIIIPCHRVTGSEEQLRSYLGGIKTRQWLLEHEQGISTHALLEP